MIWYLVWLIVLLGMMLRCIVLFLQCLLKLIGQSYYENVVLSLPIDKFSLVSWCTCCTLFLYKIGFLSYHSISCGTYNGDDFFVHFHYVYSFLFNKY